MKTIAIPLIGHKETTTQDLIKFIELLNKKSVEIDRDIYRTDGSKCEVALEYTAKGNLIGYVIYHQFEKYPYVFEKCIEGRKSIGDLADANWVIYQAYTLNGMCDDLKAVGKAEYLQLNEAEAYIDGVSVVTKFRRKGVGNALISTILRDMHDAGITYVELDSVDNKDKLMEDPSKISDANQFYYTFGFKNRIAKFDKLYWPRYTLHWTTPMLKKMYPEEEYPKRLVCPLKAFENKDDHYKFVCGLSDEDIKENN